MIFVPVFQRLDLVCDPIQNILRSYKTDIIPDDILVSEIDPQYAGGIDLCNFYNIPMEEGFNCIVVDAIRNQNKQRAACLYPVESRVDLNNMVRKQLNARRVSLASVDNVIEETKMAYGSITPLGLPKDYIVLIDSSILKQKKIIIGSGLLRSKICISSLLLIKLTGALVVEGLANQSK